MNGDYLRYESGGPWGGRFAPRSRTKAEIELVGESLDRENDMARSIFFSLFKDRSEFSGYDIIELMGSDPGRAGWSVRKAYLRNIDGSIFGEIHVVAPSGRVYSHHRRYSENTDKPSRQSNRKDGSHSIPTKILSRLRSATRRIVEDIKEAEKIERNWRLKG